MEIDLRGWRERAQIQSRGYYRIRHDGAIDPKVWNKIYSKDRRQRSRKRQTLGQSLILKNPSKEKGNSTEEQKWMPTQFTEHSDTHSAEDGAHDKIKTSGDDEETGECL